MEREPEREWMSEGKKCVVSPENWGVSEVETELNSLSSMVSTVSATGAARLKVKRLSVMLMSIASLLTRVTVRLRRPHSLSSPTIVIASTGMPIMCTCLPARIDVGLAVIAQIAPTAALLPSILCGCKPFISASAVNLSLIIGLGIYRGTSD